MAVRNFILVSLSLLLAACVQTGPARFEADLDQAAQINTQMGMDYLRQGNLEMAHNKLQKALEQSDRIATTHMGLALVYAQFGEPGKARKYFERALSLSSRDPTILNNYAVFLCDQNELEKAEQQFAKALVAPRYLTPEVAYSNAGVCFQDHDDDAKAESYYRKALEHNPRFGPALLQMAVLSFERDDFLRARGFLQRAEAVQAATANSLILGLRTEYALEDSDAVRRYADKLRAQEPGIESRIDLTNGRAW